MGKLNVFYGFKKLLSNAKYQAYFFLSIALCLHKILN